MTANRTHKKKRSVMKKPPASAELKKNQRGLRKKNPFGEIFGGRGVHGWGMATFTDGED